MKNEMTSRGRMLAALSCQVVDRVPCSFMLYKGLLSQCESYLEFIQRQVEMGLDAFVQIPPRHPTLVSDSYNLHGLPVRYHPAVEVNEWIEDAPGERWPLMVKEYMTPAGALRTEVYQDGGWPYGDHVPFLDDYLVTRSRKYIVSEEKDLQALQYLLAPPTQEEIRAFKDESQSLLDFARQGDLLTAGGWGVGADLVGWVYGLENMIFAGYDRPDFLQEMLGIIKEWNHQRMKVVLEAGIDLYIKRAWYENCDFWSPNSWRKFISPVLKEDVELAHSFGSKFGYLISSNAMPLLDSIAECGVDVLIGVDPMKWDLAAARQKLQGKVCLWGGVNGHITVEQGTPEQVRSEVQRSMEILAPGGGFILSPVDNIREHTLQARQNVQALIEEWKSTSTLARR
ncbi:MAG: hypothetical protein JXA78_19830 [Anaerolineales bacterium]|nr:hypothetical protein [Anaerolineales bacterium]